MPTGITADVVETSIADMTTTYKIGTGTATTGTTASNVAIGSTVAYTNTRNEVDVQLKKIVTGKMGDRSKSFEFSAVLKDAAGTTIKNFDNGKITTDEDGNVKHTVAEDKDPTKIYLTHEESFDFGNLPVGAKLEITEKDEQLGYTVSTAKDDEAAQEDADGKYELTIPNANCTVKFTNSKTVEIDTGVRTDITPYAILMTLAAGAGAVMFARRRRRRTA